MGRTSLGRVLGLCLCALVFAAGCDSHTSPTPTTAVTDPATAPTGTPTLVPSTPPSLPENEIGYRPELMASIPWGDREDQMPPLICSVRYSERWSFATVDPLIRYRPSLPIYVDREGDLYVLAAGFDCSTLDDPREYALFRFNADGQLSGRFELTAGDVGNGPCYLGGFAIDEESLYILDWFEEVPDSETPFRLRKISLYENTTGWAWQEATEWSVWLDQGGHLLVGPDGAVYIISSALVDSGRGTEIDPDTGRINRTFSLHAHISDTPTIASDGTLYTHGTACDLEAEECRTIGPMSGWFVGSDDEGNAYMCTGHSVARLRVGEEPQEYQWGGVVIDEELGIFISIWDAERLVLEVWNWDLLGQYLRTVVLSIPAAESLQRFAWLVQADESGFYVKDLRHVEPMGQVTELYHYSPDGELEGRQSFDDPAEDVALRDEMEALLPIESLVEGCDYIRVDGQGRLYIPVVDPQGFRVLRLTLLPIPEE